VIFMSFPGCRRRAVAHRPGPVRIVMMLSFMLFWASGFTCLLWAVHRIARAMETIARTRALKALGDELSDEDRRTIAEYVRHQSLRRY
jgi:hypothetical protein